MNTPSDGWDSDEREVLESDELGRQLAAARERHTLAAGDEARILARIQREARTELQAGSGSWRRWGIPLAGAAALVVAGTIWLVTRGGGPTADSKGPAQTAAAVTPAAAVFRLPLEKPAIKISPSALAWRGPQRENPLLTDLGPAFDAFRLSDYARADDEFARLAGKYPTSIEVAFHQGVSRLLAGNLPGAIVSLSAAERLDDRSFAWDVQWYLAVAEERAGNAAEARTRLVRLCAQPDSRQPRACEALKRFPN